MTALLARLDSGGMEAPDEELMLAYRGGDAGAFETLYARHRGRPVPLRAAQRQGPRRRRRAVPGGLDARDRGARPLCTAGALHHLALHDRAQPAGGSLAARRAFPWFRWTTKTLPSESAEPGAAGRGAPGAGALRCGARSAAAGAARGVPAARGRRADAWRRSRRRPARTRKRRRAGCAMRWRN